MIATCFVTCLVGIMELLLLDNGANVNLGAAGDGRDTPVHFTRVKDSLAVMGLL
jgi:hypothetical protein